MKQITLIFLFPFLFTACSSVPYNPRRSVQIEHHWYGKSYKQGDNRLDLDDLANKLSRAPKYRENVEKFRSRYKLSKAMLLLGGFGLAWTAGGGFDESKTLVASILVLGGGYYLDYQSRNLIYDSVRERNKMVYDYRIPNEQMARYKKAPIFPIYSKSFSLE